MHGRALRAADDGLTNGLFPNFGATAVELLIESNNVKGGKKK